MAVKRNCSVGKKRAKAPLVALRLAREDALRESFRLGGAMADLKRASDELAIATIELERAVLGTTPKV